MRGSIAALLLSAACTAPVAPDGGEADAAADAAPPPACVTDADCAARRDGARCNTLGVAYCGCATDADCPSSAFPFCPDDFERRCAECRFDADCPPGERCDVGYCFVP